MAVIRAYIANLGKYNKGELVGKWHGFPTTPTDIRQTLSEVGADRACCEGHLITGCECKVAGVSGLLGEHPSIDEVNCLASKLEGMTGREAELYEAAIETGYFSTGAKGLINLADSLDCLDYREGVCDDYGVGYSWVEESGFDMEALSAISSYIDFEHLGRDIRLGEGGVFTSHGYVRSNGKPFCEGYDGKDIPEEFKVFALPEPKPLEKPAQGRKPSRGQGAR